MSHEEKMKIAIDQVYAAMPDNKFNRFVKDLVGIYNIKEVQSIEAQLQSHFSIKHLKK